MFTKNKLLSSLGWRWHGLLLLLIVITVSVWLSRQHNQQSVFHVRLPILPETVIDMDTSELESGWYNLKFDADGRLVIDANTEPGFSTMIDELPPSDDPQVLSRLRLLMSKQMGADKADQSIAMLKEIKRYKVQERVWIEDNRDVFPPPYSSLFLLQDEVFGSELATALFGSQRKLMLDMLSGHEKGFNGADDVGKQ